jgi:hypothetical protein
MKRFIPFVLAMVGTLIGLGLAFVFTHPDVVPSSVRAIDWRRIVGSLPETPVEVVPIEELAV